MTTSDGGRPRDVATTTAHTIARCRRRTLLLASSSDCVSWFSALPLLSTTTTASESESSDVVDVVSSSSDAVGASSSSDDVGVSTLSSSIATMALDAGVCWGSFMSGVGKVSIASSKSIVVGGTGESLFSETTEAENGHAENGHRLTMPPKRASPSEQSIARAKRVATRSLPDPPALLTRAIVRAALDFDAICSLFTTEQEVDGRLVTVMDADAVAKASQAAAESHVDVSLLHGTQLAACLCYFAKQPLYGIEAWARANSSVLGAFEVLGVDGVIKGRHTHMVAPRGKQSIFTFNCTKRINDEELRVFLVGDIHAISSADRISRNSLSSIHSLELTTGFGLPNYLFPTSAIGINAFLRAMIYPSSPVTKLRIGYSVLDIPMMKAIGNVMPLLTSVAIDRSIHSIEVGTPIVAPIAEALESCPLLEKLQISEDSMTDDSVHTILGAVPKCTSLRRLILSSTFSHTPRCDVTHICTRRPSNHGSGRSRVVADVRHTKHAHVRCATLQHQPGTEEYIPRHISTA